MRPTVSWPRMMGSPIGSWYAGRSPEALAYHQRVIGRLKEQGCDAVVLGCTEIPLLVDDSSSPLPTLDSTRLLARAALRRATATSPRIDG